MTFRDILSKHFLTKIITLLLSAFCLLNPGLAQTEDVQLWSGVRLEADVFKKVSVRIEEEIRLTENISRVEDYFTDLGILYDFWGDFTFRAYYRFTRRNEIDNRISNIHRYCIDLKYEKSIYRWAVALRTRYQSRYKNINSDELGKRPDNYNRSKLSLAYDIYRSPLKPRIWFEVFYQLNNPEGNMMDKIRYSPEISYRINNNIRARVYYIIEKEYNVSDPQTNYILGTGFSYKL
ncbi:MAG: DUF2490 domain-containing protein [Bacteroidales bacterium]|nr:MAG: DUF2490 domain-containing protein [Bacteroidales bacterium]